MHKGRFSPYDLSLRTFMGNYAYPDWIRKEYTLDQWGFSLWDGPDAGLITVPPPYVIGREPSMELFADEFVYAGYVQNIGADPVWIGFVARIVNNRTETLFNDQVWIGTTRQYDDYAAKYYWSNYLYHDTAGFSPSLLPGATLWTQPRTYTAVPY